MTGPTIRLFSLAIAVLPLAGCAAFSPDGGFSGVQALVTSDLPHAPVALRTAEDAATADARVRELLKKPLNPTSAVTIALLNNRSLQAAYNTLGISEATMVRASLPPNPTFSISRVARSGAYEIEAFMIASVLDLATLPARADLAQDRFRQAQLQAALETLRIAVTARRAYVRAVASRALVGYLEQATESGEAAATLAKRLGETGAMNKLDQARNQVFAAELTAQLATARKIAASEREQLVRALGLWGATLDFRLPSQLPPLPGRPRSMPQVETEAVARRIDLQMARIEAALLAKSYGLTGATRFINLLDAGPAYKQTKEDHAVSRERGFEVELEIPLYDFGEVRVRAAEQNYMRAVNQLLAKAVNVRSEARDAYRSYRAAYDIARQYQRDVLPLRKIISDETLLRYNAMQIDVFALLTEARQRITATTAALEAQREFFLAETALGVAVLGGAGEAGPAEPMSVASSPSESVGGH